MRIEQARSLVKGTFESSFDKGRFRIFVKNLLNEMDESKAFSKPQVGQYIFDDFKDSISSLDRIGQYTDSQDKVIDILIVRLKNESSLDRARTMQRNFIGKYLKGSRGGVFKDGALVAFVAPGEKDWRFSFIKIDYSFDKKGNIKEELSPARRYSFLVGENEKSHTAGQCLTPLLEKDETNPTLEQLESAFSVEQVTKEFFEKYRSLFYTLKDSLDKIIEQDTAIKQDFTSKKINSDDFAKKLLGQIVFLYFLQKKGWFGVKRGEAWGTGSKHFLRELFNKPRNSDKSRQSNESFRIAPGNPLSHENGNPETFPPDKGGQGGSSNQFFNKTLEPLFYEALNTERTEDYYTSFNCRIPFLNGGLFEPINNYDWVNTDILLPDSLFSNQKKTKEGDTGDGILDIFDRYNFTVNEDEPLEKEVAVDPEMLGKVFENLLEVGDRKSKGTYYTPREIVHYMCQQSLINYLCSSFSKTFDNWTNPDNPISSNNPSGPDNPTRLNNPTNPDEPDNPTSPTSLNNPTNPDEPDNPTSPSKIASGNSSPVKTGIQKAKPKASLGQKEKGMTQIPKSDIEILVKSGDFSLEHNTIHKEKTLSGTKGNNKNYTGKYSQAKLPKSIVQNADLIDKKLAEIRICDPAVGSGAFPVGMMNEIIRARQALNPFINKPPDSVIPTNPVIPAIAGIQKNPPDKGGKGGSRSSYHFKRHAIEHCLYGVDIDPSAIEIAKLRLWLSLIVDEQDRNKVQPLPNLDYKMVCGNSLLGLHKDDGTDGGPGTGTKDWLYEDNIKELQEKQNLYFNETSQSKKKKYKQEIDHLIETTCVRVLKGTKGITKNQKIFDFEVYFSQVFMQNKGFDVVIANPPYVKEYVRFKTS